MNQATNTYIIFTPLSVRITSILSVLSSFFCISYFLFVFFVSIFYFIIFIGRNSSNVIMRFD